jgi:hypothetical protein
MAATIAPTAYLPGILFRSTSGAGALTVAAAFTKDYILIDTDDLTKYDSGDASDMRRLMFALLDAVNIKYGEFLAADPATNPAQWVSQMTPSISGDNITRNFFEQFITEFTGEEVADEPA